LAVASNKSAMQPPEPRVSSRRAAPPEPEPSMMAHGMEYPVLFGQVGSARLASVPSWILVKSINSNRVSLWTTRNCAKTVQIVLNSCTNFFYSPN